MYKATGEIHMREYLWNDKYSTGNTEIDAQHRQIFSMLREFQLAFYDKVSDDLVLEKINELQVYVVEHFSLEQQEMAPFKDQLVLYAEHMQHHELLIETVTVFMQRFHKEGASIAQEMYDVLGLWLDTHIKDMDIKTFEAIRALKA